MGRGSNSSTTRRWRRRRRRTAAAAAASASAASALLLLLLSAPTAAGASYDASPVQQRNLRPSNGNSHGNGPPPEKRGAGSNVIDNGTDEDFRGASGTVIDIIDEEEDEDEEGTIIASVIERVDPDGTVEEGSIVVEDSDEDEENEEGGVGGGGESIVDIVPDDGEDDQDGDGGSIIVLGGSGGGSDNDQGEGEDGDEGGGSEIVIGGGGGVGPAVTLVGSGGGEGDQGEDGDETGGGSVIVLGGGGDGDGDGGSEIALPGGENIVMPPEEVGGSVIIDGSTSEIDPDFDPGEGTIVIPSGGTDPSSHGHHHTSSETLEVNSDHVFDEAAPDRDNSEPFDEDPEDDSHVRSVCAMHNERGMDLAQKAMAKQYMDPIKSSLIVAGEFKDEVLGAFKRSVDVMECETDMANVMAASEPEVIHERRLDSAEQEESGRYGDEFHRRAREEYLAEIAEEGDELDLDLGGIELVVPKSSSSRLLRPERSSFLRGLQMETVVPEHRLQSFPEDDPHRLIEKRGGMKRVLAQMINAGVGLHQSDELKPGGAKVRVCVSDSGVSADHPELKHAKCRGSDMAFGGRRYKWNVPPTTKKSDIHGTHLAGTVWAKDDDEGIRGVITDSENDDKIECYVTRSLRDDGRGSFSQMARAVEDCVEDGKADIILLSLGCSCKSAEECSRTRCYTDLMNDFFQHIANQNILVIAAAGNTYQVSKLFYPAGYKSVMSIGACDDHGNLGGISNINKHVEAVAHGEYVMSTAFDAEEYGYIKMRGTSMAGAQAAGLAALIWSNHPSCTAQQIRNAMLVTAMDRGEGGCDHKYGHGVIRAKDASDALERFGCDLGGTVALSDTPVACDVVGQGSEVQQFEDILKTTSLSTTPPTSGPTSGPTSSPTHAPTAMPTAGPTSSPTSSPTSTPTAGPTSSPTSSPTSPPTAGPTSSPTSTPTSGPTSAPTSAPTSGPTSGPTDANCTCTCT